MVELELENDFAAFDGATTVVVCDVGLALRARVVGLRRAPGVRELEAAGGKYLAGDVEWHFSAADLPTPPRVGTSIEETDGPAWTIVGVRLEALGTRFRCTARRWEIVAGLNERVDIRRAVWTKTASGVPVAEWTDFRLGLAARLQPLELRRERASSSARLAEPTSLRGTHRLFLAEAVELDANCRVYCGGAVYDVLGVDDRERLDRGLAVLLEVVP